MFKRKPNKDLKIDTLIGAGTQIEGDLLFTGGLHLDGTIQGNVTAAAPAGSADTTLSVSEQGCIEGSVRATHVLLNGLVKGDIDATDRVELGPKARVLGNVSYGAIETAVGAQINGRLIHKGGATGPDADPAGGTPL